MIHHRTDQFKAIYEKVHRQLQEVFVTKQPVLVLLGSGTAAMEAAVAGLVAPGEKMISFNGGKFGERWAKIGKALGCVVHEVVYDWTEFTTPAMVEKAIADCPDAVAVFTQLNETASGIRNPIKEIAAVCHKHNKLIVVDGISGLTAMPCPMDEWGLDVVLSRQPEGLYAATGPGLHRAVDKAIAKLNATPMRVFYNDLKAQLKNHGQSTHAWTSGVSLYQQLSTALDMMLAEGLENVIHRCHVQGEAVRAAAKALGFKLMNEKSPGDVLTSILMPENIKSSAVAKYCRGNWGLYYAAGQDPYKDAIIRIGHLGYQDHFETIMAIAGFEMAMKHFGVNVELGKGVKVAEEILMADLEAQEKKATAAG